MSVPFESLGPGQSGRLVYQVMGKNGSILNPAGIRYLPPDQAPSLEGLASDGPGLVAGLAGINLAVSLGNLALTAAVYGSVKQLHTKIDKISVDISEMKEVLENISARTERIDVRVAENNLREAMKHAFKKAWNGEGLDLSALVPLREDVAAISQTLDHPLILDASIRLASDVRDNLTMLFSLLRNLRLAVIRNFNRSVDCDPEFCIRCDPLDDYLAEMDTEARFVHSYYRILEAKDGFYESSVSLLAERFSFCDEEDQEAFTEVFNETLVGPMITAMLDSPGDDEFCNLPKEAFEGEAEEVAANVRSLSEAWLWNSDSGLLLRAEAELLGIEHGYRGVFCRFRRDPPCLPDFMVACALPGERQEPPNASESHRSASGFWKK